MKHNIGRVTCAWLGWAVFGAGQSASGQVLNESAKLLASDGAAGDHFGISVSLDGARAIVGAYFDDCSAGSDCGSAYVYRYDGSTWVQEQKLTASDAAEGDLFGVSVSLDGARAIVAAYWDDCPAGFDCGSAYIYRYDGTTWVEEQKLNASDAGAYDWFGFSVSLSGDRAIVGARMDDCPAGPDCGSAYIYRYDGTAWVQEQKLTASDAAAYDYFGESVSLDGARAIVGAVVDDCPAGLHCGSAYVFRYDGTSWVEEQKLTASDAAAEDYFGESVSLDGARAIVGAYRDDCPAGLHCGSAYVFRYDGTSWVEEQKLLPSDAAAGDVFGISVSLSGTRAIVGAYFDDCSAGSDCGSAYAFRYDPGRPVGDRWVQEQKLTPSDAAAGDNFGWSVSVSGDVAVVGAYQDDDNGTDSGSAYVFSFVGACCLPNGTCERLEEATCTANEGHYLGDGIPCTKCGACCLPANGCTLKVTDVECHAVAGGHFEGNGTTSCTHNPNGTCTLGACCRANNVCTLDTTYDECVKLGGRYEGDGSTTCAHNAAGDCIPTLSEWGMVAMAALMLAAGAVVVSRRRAAG